MFFLYLTFHKKPLFQGREYHHYVAVYQDKGFIFHGWLCDMIIRFLIAEPDNLVN